MILLESEWDSGGEVEKSSLDEAREGCESSGPIHVLRSWRFVTSIVDMSLQGIGPAKLLLAPPAAMDNGRR